LRSSSGYFDISGVGHSIWVELLEADRFEGKVILQNRQVGIELWYCWRKLAP
jgi:hypothetical protein